MICCDCRDDCAEFDVCDRCRRPTCDRCVTRDGRSMLCSDCYEETVHAE